MTGAGRPAGAADRPLLIGSEIYRSSSYGTRHPLAIPRVSTCIDLCRALGWLPDSVYIDSPRATPEQLARFHDPAYIVAVRQAESLGTLPTEARDRFNIGRKGNPIFPEVFRRPATACGASILAGQLLAAAPAGRQIIYSPAGGTHHGLAGRANGFCYFNDPVLAILALLDAGVERVLYLDFDAHHADGVQIALSEEPRVSMLSVHEDGRWPMDGAGRGGASDRAGGRARNIPVPGEFNDSEMDYVIEAAVLPTLEEALPAVVVVQCGSDALADDPLSKLGLSNRALWRAVAAVRDRAPRLLVLGGGGYNPWSVGRCWAGVWATLNGFAVPERLPSEAEEILRAITWRHRRGRNPEERWFTTLADPGRPGPVREEVRSVVAEAMRA